MRKKIAAIVTVAPLALTLTAGTAMATSYAASAEQGNPEQSRYHRSADLACVTLLDPDASPAELQIQAQTILTEDPSDPSDLDADDDGIACEFTETSAGEVAFEDGSGFVSDRVQADTEYDERMPGEDDPARNGEDLACAAVLGPEAGPEELRQEAQMLYNADPADPNNLDANGNGSACEFSYDAAGDTRFEDGSGFVSDLAQYQERPFTKETPEPEVTPTPHAAGLQGTVIDEASTTPSASLEKPSALPKLPVLRELPATGGALALPITTGSVVAGGIALLGVALLFGAKRLPSNV